MSDSSESEDLSGSDVEMSSDSDDSENAPSKETEDAEEEEDSTILAIKREHTKKRDHPPAIQSEDFITDICFHPERDILAVANVVGDVLLYQYAEEENKLIETLELHTRACRDVEFSADGKILFSASKDKSIMLSDVDSGKLIRFYETAHDDAVNCLRIIDENLFATGDDDGIIKMWDLREKGAKQIYRTKKNEDYISDMITDESRKYLVCSSGDGSLTSIDIQNRSVYLQSEEYEEELTCLGYFKSETKLLSGSSKGKLFIFNFEEYGLHSDAFPGPKTAINALVPITENIVVTACEDGNLRATHLFPHRHLGIVGQHELSVENIDICNNGSFIASSSHNNDIKFWNIQYFEDLKVNVKHKKHDKKKELRTNLPSSKMKDAAEFFGGLC